MTDYKVTFLPHNEEVKVAAGESLIRAAMEAGGHINASCGGEGACGKCRVLTESGELAGGDVGAGRMSEPEAILAVVEKLLEHD